MKITIANPEFEVPIILEEGIYFTLSVENPQTLFNVLTELKNQINEEEGGFVISREQNKPLSFSKNCAVITDLTAVDLNDKKINTLVAKKFCEFLENGEQAAKLTDIESAVFDLVDEFKINSGLNVENDGAVTAAEVAKAAGIKIADKSETLLEKLCEYVSLTAQLKDLKVMILAFAKEFLSAKDVESLRVHCRNEAVSLLIVEGKDASPPAPTERRLTIDGDLCFLTSNYDGARTSGGLI